MLDDVEPPWARLPRALAAAIAPQTARLQDQMIALIDADPAWTARMGQPKVRADLVAATAAVTSRFVALIATREAAFAEPDRGLFRDLGAGEARDGRGLEDLLAAYRIGTRVLYAQVAHELSLLDSSPVAQVALAETVFALVDTMQAESADGYAHEVTTHSGERERRLRRLADALFAGDVEALRPAAAQAGWSPPARLAVVLLPIEAALEARSVPATGGLVLERDGSGVAVVTAEREVAPEVARLASLAGPHRAVRVGPTVDLLAAGRSLAIAQLLPENQTGWAADRLPELLPRAAPAVFATLREHRLAALAGLPAAQRERLTATLAAWLRHWGQRLAVAEELGIHPQTVAYRINQLRELFGDRFDDPRWRLETQLALLPD